MSGPPDTLPDPPASEITDSSELGPLIKQSLAQDPDVTEDTDEDRDGS